MGTPIVKLGSKYVEWSEPQDAPQTAGLTLEGLERYVRAEYGRCGIVELAARMVRVEAFGTSCFDQVSGRDFVAGNRAGADESELSFGDLIALYDGGALDEANDPGWYGRKEAFFADLPRLLAEATRSGLGTILTANSTHRVR